MKDIEVNGKNIKLRVVAFLVALVVGISAFGIAFYQLTKREPGYYEITPTRDEAAPMYANGVSFYCYLDGESSQIRSNLQRAESVYSEALGRIYRVLNAEETFEGYTNLATLNQHPGEDIALPQELYDVLTDALDRAERYGWSLRQGALFYLWSELLYLEAPEEFDPSVNEVQRGRILEVKAALDDPESVRLEIVDPEKRVVRLDLSEACRDVLARNEVEGPAFSLGALQEAYMLEYVRDKLVEAGFSRGVLKTSSGLYSTLPLTTAGDLWVHSFVQGKPEEAAAISLGNGSAACVYRSFSLGEAGYYEINGILRHPYINEDGAPNSHLLTVCVTSQEGNLVDAAIRALALYGAPYPAMRQKMKELSSDAALMAVIEADAPKMILLDPRQDGRIQPILEGGYAISYLGE